MVPFSRRGAVVLTAGFALIGSGAAFAYIAADGGGTGTATSATLRSVVVTGSVLGGIGPTDTAVPLTVRYTNPNNFVVTSLNGIRVTVTSVPEGCVAGEFTTAGIPGPIDFAPNAVEKVIGGATLKWSETGANQSRCFDALRDVGLGLTFDVL